MKKVSYPNCIYNRMSNYFYEKGVRVFPARKTVLKMKKSIIVTEMLMNTATGTIYTITENMCDRV